VLRHAPFSASVQEADAEERKVETAGKPSARREDEHDEIRADFS
jgi:hypothetical protein